MWTGGLKKSLIPWKKNRRHNMNIRLNIGGGIQPLIQKGGKALILVSTTSMEGGQRRKGVIPRG